MFSAPIEGKDINPETCFGLRKISSAAVRAERSSGLWSGNAGVKPVAVTQGILRSEMLQWRGFQQSSSPSRDLQAAQVTTAACFFSLLPLQMYFPHTSSGKPLFPSSRLQEKKC